MRTTLDIEDELFIRAKTEAARTKRSLKAVVEEALRELFASTKPRGSGKFKLKLPTVRGTRPPAVDISDRSALYDFLDKHP